jgi:DNA polymerase-1
MTTLIIDAMNIFVRSYVVVPSMSEHGHHVGGTLGFLKSLGSYSRKFSPNRIIVVWEGGGSPRRRALLKEYKGNRKPVRLNRSDIYEDIPDSRENFNYQVAATTKLLSHTSAEQMYVSDCEADDIIGYLAKNILDEEIIIASSDKDFYQLLKENVSMYSPTKKKIITHKDVLEEHGISCVNFATARCFVGDSSDNIDGVKGVGLKSLAKRFPMLRNDEFVSCDDIINLCREVPEKKRIKLHERILEAEPIIKRNWKLMYLDTSNLAADQIIKIKEKAQYNPRKADKIGMIRNLIEEGINMPKSFDPHKFFMNTITANKR